MAAFARREKGGSLSTVDAVAARSAFSAHLSNLFKIVELDSPLTADAMTLATRFALRGYDAIQLASALSAHQAISARGLPPLTLISADKELNTAALSSGLIINDPNLHP